MARRTAYTIAWSETLQAYEIVHTPFSYPLTASSLELWLCRADSFFFRSALGDTCTLKQEGKQRGTAYWYAYKRVQGRLRKKYLGTTETVTLARLEQVAHRFLSPIEQEPPPPPPPPPRTPTLRFTKSLESALSIYGFHRIPEKNALLLRYRELSKRYHPDVGGLHEDMVAVNLAYELLKKYV